MRPLGIYHIEISIYILNKINFLMISCDFGGFFKMHTDIRTDGQTLEDASKKTQKSKKKEKKEGEQEKKKN